MNEKMNQPVIIPQERKQAGRIVVKSLAQQIANDLTNDEVAAIISRQDAIQRAKAELTDVVRATANRFRLG